MDVDGLPIVGAAVDFTKVSPIYQKRTLAFLNHFVAHTVNFLNKFSSVCEIKLEEINVRIQRIETSLTILEAKLSSIPGLDDVTLTEGVDSSAGNVTSTTTTTREDSFSPQIACLQDSSTEESKQAITADISETTREPPHSLTLTVAQDQRYVKYLKLIQMGVPQMALRPKMLADGLNPDLLATPNAPAPPATTIERNQTESESEANTSEFSD